jgi:CheY-like chemotaxis protein
MNMSGNTMAKPIEILLVDDNLEDAWRTIESLNQDDTQWRVIVVGNGEDGMPLLDQQGAFDGASGPDVILLDTELSENDGRQVLAAIRADRELRGVPVIVLTDLLLHEAAREAEIVHVDGFMTKPPSSRQFSKVVESVCRSRRDAPGVPPVDSSPATTIQENVAIPTPTPAKVGLLSQSSDSLNLPTSAV